MYTTNSREDNIPLCLTPLETVRKSGRFSQFSTYSYIYCIKNKHYHKH